MADLHTQAQAIWNTLNTMLAQDPDGYKKFINEQLKEGKKTFKKSQSTDTRNEGTSDHLESSFKNLVLDSSLRDLKPTDPKTKSGEKLRRKKPSALEVLDEGKKDLQDGKHKHTATMQEQENELLDDTIKGSILSQIVVTNQKKTDDEDSEPAITELKIPSYAITPTSGSKIVKKPLIEEL